MSLRSKILKEFQHHSPLAASKLVGRFKVSRQAINRHLTGLIRDGLILKQGTSRKTSFYLLNHPSVVKKVLGGNSLFKKRCRLNGLEEDRIFSEVDRELLLSSHLSQNTQGLVHYAFTEILNNAIDHSKSRMVDIKVDLFPHAISFVIDDHGIGIFENIRMKKGLQSEIEGLQDLLKGKQTTLPKFHSGEGIFFTSKIADRLVIESHKKSLIVDNRLEDLFVKDIHFKTGTRVSFEIDKGTKKKLNDVFKQYTNENFQFDRSHIAVKLYREGTDYVSRSQAKRLLHALSPFREITLDFKGITTIGQGFADEIFRVFLSQHSGVKIIPIHCHENVQFMIDRVNRP